MTYNKIDYSEVYKIIDDYKKSMSQSEIDKQKSFN